MSFELLRTQQCTMIFFSVYFVIICNHSCNHFSPEIFSFSKAYDTLRWDKSTSQWHELLSVVKAGRNKPYVSLLLSFQRNLPFPLLIPFSSKGKASDKKFMPQKARREGSFRQVAVGIRGQIMQPATSRILQELCITDLRYQEGVSFGRHS